MTYIVDTHALVWFFEMSKRLGRRAAAVLRDETDDLVVPTIVLAELRHAAERGKVTATLEAVLRSLREDPRARIYPLDERVIECMPTGLDIHDAIICGTALMYQQLLQEDVKVLTRDKAIIGAGVVETAW